MLAEEICREPELWQDEIVKMQTMKNPVVLFGAGNTREFNLEYFYGLGIAPSAFCDNAVHKIGGKVGELDILSFEQVRERYPDAYFYITTQLSYCELCKQILDGGYAPEQISEYDIIFQLPWEKNCINYYMEHGQELEELYESLSDECSRQILRNRLLFLRTRKRKYLTEVRERNQYFSKELIDFEKIDCFVDLGMYTGDTIVQFLEVTKGKYKKIYGFEPDEQIYQTARENLKEFPDITLVKKGTSDFDGQVQVTQALGVMQSIESGVFDAKKATDNSFEVCKLDTFFGNQEMSGGMLKLDIEGAEMAALRGGAEWIRKNRPVIAVCVYHKQEDIFELPAFCKGLVPEYKIYFRHYSDNQTETVCYLVM